MDGSCGFRSISDAEAEGCPRDMDYMLHGPQTRDSMDFVSVTPYVSAFVVKLKMS